MIGRLVEAGSYSIYRRFVQEYNPTAKDGTTSERKMKSIFDTYKTIPSTVWEDQNDYATMLKLIQDKNKQYWWEYHRFVAGLGIPWQQKVYPNCWYQD